MENANVRRLEGLGKVNQLLVLVGCGNEKKFGGLAGEDGLQRGAEFRKVVMDRGNDHCHVRREEGGIGRDRNTTIEPV